jgi:hypothetical protein
MLKNRLSIAAAAGAGAVLAGSGPAAAVPVVPVNQAFVSSAVDAVYRLPANRHGWSIAATQGIEGGQSDVEIRLPGGPVLARSAAGFGPLDWVAVNTGAGRLPAGRFDVRVTADTDSGRPTTHFVQLVTGGAELVPGRAAEVGRTDRTWLADVRDLPLRAGDMVSLKVSSAVGTVSVLDDGPDPARWPQTPDTAELTFELPKPDTDDDTFTVTFVAPGDGDYGVVFAARTPESRGAVVRADIVG